MLLRNNNSINILYKCLNGRTCVYVFSCMVDYDRKFSVNQYSTSRHYTTLHVLRFNIILMRITISVVYTHNIIMTRVKIATWTDIIYWSWYTPGASVHFDLLSLFRYCHRYIHTETQKEWDNTLNIEYCSKNKFKRIFYFLKKYIDNSNKKNMLWKWP